MAVTREIVKGINAVCLGGRLRDARLPALIANLAVLGQVAVIVRYRRRRQFATKHAGANFDRAGRWLEWGGPGRPPGHL